MCACLFRHMHIRRPEVIKFAIVAPSSLPLRPLLAQQATKTWTPDRGMCHTAMQPSPLELSLSVGKLQAFLKGKGSKLATATVPSTLSLPSQRPCEHRAEAREKVGLGVTQREQR